ncbi:hypothetical protein [Lysinibacillus sp. BW-2-10]|uniref:hypothetical protein n=1 Tax=Lysinibacillus sp. BW-2-10 TaxID=2590030 RepID=UPI00117D2992|nr:hypothetical protein [Lysinibacillus sp. BW-2-10]TSI03940.1 hypothetical protein FJQ64_15435 [Lysinibacillus sp. BW-2-10]
MLITTTLLLLGLIQFLTAFAMFFSYQQKGNSFYGVKAPNVENLNEKQSIFRYMLSGLWLSVSIIYFVGAFNPNFTSAACLLAVMNTSLELVGYWLGRIPRWIPIGGTFVFGAIAIICLFHI